jgi:5-methylcytosine-specific restriction protein A
MPGRPLHPCAQNGCPVLLPHGTSRCEKHQLPSRDRSRPSRHARGYSAAWDRLRRQILERDHHTCVYCGAPATSVDHRIAKSLGGSDDPENLVAACVSCNSGKKDRPFA